MKDFKCIITGCALILPGLGDKRWVAGDLFDCGEHYVFVGSVDKRGSVRYHDLSDGHVFRKQLEPSDWFERRGIFIIHKSEAGLNQMATNYIYILENP